MSDLNEWRLAYPGTTLDFGTLDTDYPLAVQVDVGTYDLTTQDQSHPTSDGAIFGRDKFGGFTLTFDGRIIPEWPLTATPWHSALDLYSAFKAKWRADSIRRVAGSYATLSNLDRERMVYGRPRKCDPKTTAARRGLMDFVATFDTNDPNFYDTTEKVALITPIPPSSGGFTVPLTPPFSTAVGTGELAPMVNEGDLQTWPVVEFHGPGVDHSLELLAGVSHLWKIVITGKLAYDEVLRVDTRPWSRSATLNGKPANGRLRGSQIELCTLPVGTFSARYKVKDASGTAFADIRWRDAYASL